MARKSKHAEHANHERWLVSYADFITLLFAFFVVMFATSQTDKAKAKQLSESVQEAIENGKFSAAMKSVFHPRGAKTGPPIGNTNPPDAKGQEKMSDLRASFEALRKDLKEEIDAGRIDVAMEPRGLAISFKQAALFPSGEDTISPAAFDSLAKVAAAVQKVNNPVHFEGHTDSLPIHTSRFRSNWELSAARSIALLELFTTRYQITRDRMSIGGYAEVAPIDSNDSEEGRARNRRVDVILLNEFGMGTRPTSRPEQSAVSQPQPKKA